MSTVYLKCDNCGGPTLFTLETPIEIVKVGRTYCRDCAPERMPTIEGWKFRPDRFEIEGWGNYLDGEWE